MDRRIGRLPTLSVISQSEHHELVLKSPEIGSLMEAVFLQLCSPSLCRSEVPVCLLKARSAQPSPLFLQDIFGGVACGPLQEGR